MQPLNKTPPKEHDAPLMGAAAPLPPPLAAASSGSATNQAGSTKQVGSTTSRLAAALVLKDKFIESLHIMLQPFR
jgi:hypothetical protein